MGRARWLGRVGRQPGEHATIAMALATRCPHCNTTFRVVQDQLKLRAGLVRCGACKEIFNGIEHLLRPDEPAPASVPVAPEETRDNFSPDKASGVPAEDAAVAADAAPILNTPDLPGAPATDA